MRAGSSIASDTSFQLFETMYATNEDGVRNLDRHLKRLESSAVHFAFSFSSIVFRTLLRQQCAEMLPHLPYRVRATLYKSGQIDCVKAPLHALTGDTVSLLLASEYGLTAQSANSEWLLHKTTFRKEYDHGWQLAEKCGAFDTLFFNERDELTEGGRSNVFVKLNSRWWTPPVSSGLLPGVMRALVLEDIRWNAAERVLTLEDLEHAEELMVCNALRGVMRASLLRKS